jgi:transposase
VIPTEDPRDAVIREQAARIAQLEKRVEELLALVATIPQLQARIADLEARLKVNSSNSSKPPSSDGPAVVRAKAISGNTTKKKRGGQIGHKGHSRMILPADEVVRYEPSICSGCGGALQEADIATEDGALWQVSELPVIRARVTSHIAAGRQCRCGCITHGSIPVPILAHGYGPRFVALVSLLTTRYGMSRRDVEAFCGSVLGVPVSTGTVCALGAELGKALQVCSDEAIDFVRTELIVHADETSWCAEKKNGWLWVAVCCWVTVFLFHKRRSKEAAACLLGEEFAGIIVTDRWNSYNMIPLFRRQFCLAHLLRDAQGMAERGGDGAAIGRDLVIVFREAILLHRKRRDGDIDQKHFETRGAELQAECHRLLQKGAVLIGNRDAKTHGMCKRLITTESALWTFLRHHGVEPTNNIAERAIRPAVIVRKTSFGSDSLNGAVYFARILSAIASLQTQGRCLLEFLEATIRDTRAGITPPSLLPLAPMS